MTCRHWIRASLPLLSLALLTRCSAGTPDTTVFGDTPPGASAADGGTAPGTGTPSPSPTPGSTGSPGTPSTPGAPASDAGGAPPHDAGAVPADARAPVPDAGTLPPPPPSSSDAGASGDGPPTRRTCTGSFGSGLSSQHARLDGTVVAVIPPGQGKQCNGDSSHVHLQVLMKNAVYDVAANVDGLMLQKDSPMLDGAWSEGWHSQASLDYPADLGVHSTDFSLTGVSAVAQAVETALAQANHVSVFCTGYGPDGCHLVHRQRSGSDGAIVLDPLSATPRWLLFDFSTDHF